MKKLQAEVEGEFNGLQHTFTFSLFILFQFCQADLNEVLSEQKEMKVLKHFANDTRKYKMK